MRNFKWTTNLLLLLVVGCFLLSSCGGQSDSKEDDNSLFVGSAIITTANGDKVDFKATIDAGTNLGDMSAAIGIGNSKAAIVIHIDFAGDPIGPGVYEGSLSLTPINHSTKVVDEKYMDAIENPQTGEPGVYTIEITDYEPRKYAKGTFSGTIYSERGKMVTISEGKFNVTD